MIWAAIVLIAAVFAMDNGEETLPIMGWNSWNAYHADVSSEKIVETANLFVSLGLKDLGWNVVCTDDGWAERERDVNGNQVAASNFPGGLQNVTKLVNARGLKFGVYSAAGILTCLDRAGSLFSEVVDARNWKDWGIEYLKFDACEMLNWNSYAKDSVMRDALNASDYRIPMATEPHVYTPMSWVGFTANSARTGGDIQPKFERVLYEAMLGAQWSSVIEPRSGFHADLDMLELGNGMNPGEERYHFAIWCMLKSPLFIGTDLAKIPNSSLALLKNTDLIAVSQDSRGEMAYLVATSAPPSDVFWHPRIKVPEYVVEVPAISQISIPATYCQPAETADDVPLSQQISMANGRSTIRQGTQCLEQAQDGSISFQTCSTTNTNQIFDTNNVTTTVSQIRTPNNNCLTIDGDATPTVSSAPCIEIPSECFVTRTPCRTFENSTQWFYRSNATLQLISVWTPTNQSAIYFPPLCLATSPIPSPPIPPTPPTVNFSLPLQVWGGRLANNDFVVALANTLDSSSSPTPINITAKLSDIPNFPTSPQTYSVRDLIHQKDLPWTVQNSITALVPSSDIAVFRLSPKNQ